MLKIYELFGFNFYLYTKKKKLLKSYNAIETHELNEVDGRAFHLEKNGVNHFVAYLCIYDSKTIAHECSHLVTYFCDHLNIHNDEFRSYLLGDLVESVHKSGLIQ